MAIANENIALARYLLDRGCESELERRLRSNTLYGSRWSFAMWKSALTVASTMPTASTARRRWNSFKTLIKRGANVNARTTDWPPTRRYLDATRGSFVGELYRTDPPFLRAALSGDVTVMKLLIEKGAQDPKIETEEGTTPLMAAAGINWVVAQTYTESDEAILEAVKLCIDLGADVNLANSMGLSAFHGAANRGSDHVIQFLADRGAKMDAKDKEGRTPYVWAEGVFLATNAPVARPSSMSAHQRNW